MIDRTQAPAACPGLDGHPVEVLQAVGRRRSVSRPFEPDAGFFDLGATSEMMLGVVRTLRGRWPCLRIVNIFSHPTVEQLAAFLGDE